MSAAITERYARASFGYAPASRVAHAINRRNGKPIAIVSPKLARLIDMAFAALTHQTHLQRAARYGFHGSQTTRLPAVRCSALVRRSGLHLFRDLKRAPPAH